MNEQSMSELISALEKKIKQKYSKAMNCTKVTLEFTADGVEEYITTTGVEYVKAKGVNVKDINGRQIK